MNFHLLKAFGRYYRLRAFLFPMTHIGLFEGIGGFSLAAKWMGWETKAWCEINPFCQQVLKYYYREAEGFTDIKKSDFTKYANRIDVLTGGFPCQPYSQAGKRLGKEDERHLWPEMYRAIREIQPSYVLGENVRGLTNWNGGMVFDEVQADLEAEGYEVLPFLLPACAVNAPHRRDRIWFIAYSESNGNRTRLYGMESQDGSKWQSEKHRENDLQYRDYGTKRAVTNADSVYRRREFFGNGQSEGHTLWQPVENNGEYGDATYPDSGQRCEGGTHQAGQQETERYTSTRDAWNNGRGAWDDFPTQSPLCSRNDGLSAGLSGITFSKHRNESIKAYGNAIVPQVALEIFKAIEKYNSLT